MKYKYLAVMANVFEDMYQRGDMPWIDPKGNEPPEVKEFVHALVALNIKKPVVVDMGCGNGWISVMLAKRSCVVYGIDASGSAINKAKALAEKEGVRSLVDFRLGDVTNLPYQPRSFDGAFDRGLFHHIPGGFIERYKKELLRVLRDKSIYSLSHFSLRTPLSYGVPRAKSEIEEFFGKEFDLISFHEDPIVEEPHLNHYVFRRKQKS